MILPSEIYAENGAVVEFENEGNDLSVYMTAGVAPVSTLTLRWNFDEKYRADVKVLSDCWERSYGDQEWRSIYPDRWMPWAFMVSNGSDSVRDAIGRVTECWGVKARPGAMISWQFDREGVTLIADTRAGGEGVILNGRKLKVCTAVNRVYRDMYAFDAANEFYKELCDDAVLPDYPVFGSNNWYYAYGKSSRSEIIADAELIGKLTQGFEKKACMVIDDGWTYDGDIYGDMKTLADEISARNAIPGIWIRFLNDDSNLMKDAPESWRLGHGREGLDPSMPEVLEMAARTMRTLTYDYGYKVIKHDFSFFDVFGNWGFRCPERVTGSGWSFSDRSRTSAEVMENFYKVIYEAAAPGTVIIGCNVPGFLSAGYCHLNRVSDDTSGREWARTRKMGVNAAAFRRMYDKSFYRADCDCVGITGEIGWDKNSKWTTLAANTSTPLFLSIKPGVCTEEELNDIRNALKISMDQNTSAVPLDWMENVCPEEWLINGEKVTFDWSGR